MRVAFLTIAGSEHVLSRGGYGDLLRTFADNGHEVYAVCAAERRRQEPTTLTVHNQMRILSVRTGNLQKVPLPEKLVATMLVERQFIAAIKKYLDHVTFDLVLYATPPITFDRVVRYLKERDGAVSYLLLKDIFPQNAVDMGMIRRGGLAWRYFRSREKRLYANSDFIGCMSEGNMRYVLEHDPEVPRDKIEVCPNNVDPVDLSYFRAEGVDLRSVYGIPAEAVLLLYGGNLGVPQGLNFLLRILDACRDRSDVYFLIVGSGTQYAKMRAHMDSASYSNAQLMSAVPKDQYDSLLGQCDIGLVFLDPRFTIPNFPSRVNAYMEAAVPILAATDKNTDLRDVLDEARAGLWVENGDLAGFLSALDRLVGHEGLRAEMGRNGREYLEKHFTSSLAYQTILARLEAS